MSGRPVAAGVLVDEFKRLADEHLAAQDPDAEVARLEELARERERAARRERARRLEGSGITVDDAARRLIITGELDPAVMAYRVVDAWLDVHAGRRVARDEPGRVLVLAGGTGAGKSSAAAWALAQLGGIAVTSVALSEAVGSRWHEDRDLVQRVLRSTLVTIEDVGVDELDRARVALERVVDARQASPCLTILTTNLEEPAFLERVGARVASRLARVGRFVACKGRDLRRERPAASGDTAGGEHG